jgi:hypothetical protein
MNSTINDLIVSYKKELGNLTFRANKVNYRNKPPRLPKNPTESTLSGYRKRLANWTKVLIQLEKERKQLSIKEGENLLQKISSHN